MLSRACLSWENAEILIFSSHLEWSLLRTTTSAVKLGHKYDRLNFHSCKNNVSSYLSKMYYKNVDQFFSEKITLNYSIILCSPGIIKSGNLKKIIVIFGTK